MKSKLLCLKETMFYAIIFVAITVQTANANPGSKNVVIIGGTAGQALSCSNNYSASYMGYTYGGCLQTTGPVGELGDFVFTAMAPGAVSASSLTAYDTAVLNVASTGMYCNTTNLNPTQKQAIIDFVAAGKKLIIFDSECWTAQDYNWLPFPFTTNNPGAMGAHGTLTIVEENTLSSNNPASPYYINATYLGNSIDAVGDMNVMTTHNPNWCLDMSGTNYNGVTGPVHTYAKYPSGTDRGLIIYNGMDQDYQAYNDSVLRKVWVQELKQPFNPSSLPCGYTVLGITLTPATAVNLVGTSHTVTATLSDLLKNPIPGKQVSFNIKAGPNVAATGMCSPDVNCVTNTQGQVNFTYISNGTRGKDEIDACFYDNTNTLRCSQTVTKLWTIKCDINKDGAVNIDDINLINAKRGTTDILFDMDNDGLVTTNDARACVLKCDKSLCAK